MSVCTSLTAPSTPCGERVGERADLGDAELGAEHERQPDLRERQPLGEPVGLRALDRGALGAERGGRGEVGGLAVGDEDVEQLGVGERGGGGRGRVVERELVVAAVHHDRARAARRRGPRS